MATYIVNISSFDESTLSPDRKYKVGFVVKGEGREKEVMDRSNEHIETILNR